MVVLWKKKKKRKRKIGSIFPFLSIYAKIYPIATCLIFSMEIQLRVIVSEIALPDKMVQIDY